MKTPMQPIGPATWSVEVDGIRVSVRGVPNYGGKFSPNDDRWCRILAAARLAELNAEGPQAFRLMRRSLEMTAKELGKLIDVSAYTISRWENGKQKFARYEWLMMAALVLDKAKRRVDMERLMKCGGSTFCGRHIDINYCESNETFGEMWDRVSRKVEARKSRKSKSKRAKPRRRTTIANRVKKEKSL